jgi:hypothetical protein
LPPKLENLVKITLEKPKISKISGKKKKKKLVLISPNLAKLSYGLSPLQLHHKIQKKQKKTKTLKI